MDLVFFVWREKGSVERVMNFPRFGEAELVRNRREDFNDSEGSFTFRGELGVGDRAFEVSGL